MEFWRDKSALMRRASEIKKYTDAKWIINRRKFYGKYKHNFVAYTECIAPSWKEFKDISLWHDVFTINKKYNISQRTLRYWCEEKFIIAVKVKNRWHINLNSLHDFQDVGIDVKTFAKFLEITVKKAYCKIKEDKIKTIIVGSIIKIIDPNFSEIEIRKKNNLKAIIFGGFEKHAKSEKDIYGFKYA